MLEYLRIRNLALIEDMELEFASGFNVLTGETGAGKSFILKALNFLTGDRLTADMVRAGREKAQVEALFVLPDGEYVLRRELTAATGRSRLFINDQLSSQEATRSLRPSLIVHTSQHGQHKLLSASYQAKLLDTFMKRTELLEQRDETLRALKELAARRHSLEERSKTLEERRDVLEYQQHEIEKVAPEAGEEEALETRRNELREAATLYEGFEQASLLLRGDDGPGVFELLSQLERSLEGLSKIDTSFAEDVEAVALYRGTLHELERRLRRRPTISDDKEAEEIEERLFVLAQLKRKLRRSLEEIVDLRTEIDENLSFLDMCGLELKQLERQEASLSDTLRAILAELNPARHTLAEELSRSLEKELAGLGFSEHVRVLFSFTPEEIWHDCFEERARLLWVPNPGQSPQPLDKIASGGELSRFLLAVVGLMAQGESATLIFDEVDAGVGGLTLNHVANRLESLASHRQVLCITHWPQLAARAARHFQVRKVVDNGVTFTLCEQLDKEAIHEELVRMAGGGSQGEAMAHELTAPPEQLLSPIKKST